MKKFLHGLMMLVVLLSLAACTTQKTTTKSKQSSTTHTTKKVESPYLQTTTPTFYVHGFQGSAKSTNTLIEHATKQADAHKVLVATVASDGTINYSGEWHQGRTNPIIQVVFTNNIALYSTQSAWLLTIIQTLARRYHFNQYNVVAHSAGNVATVNMLMTANKPSDFPKIEKFVSIAGCYNGIIGEDDQANQNYFLKDGEPALQHSAYQMLAAEKQNFPDNVSILNIVGDLDDGSNSDELVSNVSARSLKPLISGHHARYTEKDFYGAKAQHSQLHENSKVATVVDQYLWGNPNYQK